MGIEGLGITNDDLLELVVGRLCIQFESRDNWEEDYWQQRVERRVGEAMHEKVDAVFTETITPRVDAIIDAMVIRRTSIWGEVKGEPQTLREYIAGRIDGWLDEKVDHEGNPSTYNRGSDKTRIQRLVDKHMSYEVEKAVRDAMGAAQKGFVKILSDQVVAHIQGLAEQFKMSISRT